MDQYRNGDCEGGPPSQVGAVFQVGPAVVAAPAPVVPKVPPFSCQKGPVIVRLRQRPLAHRLGFGEGLKLEPLAIRPRPNPQLLAATGELEGLRHDVGISGNGPPSVTLWDLNWLEFGHLPALY